MIDKKDNTSVKLPLTKCLNEIFAILKKSLGGGGGGGGGGVGGQGGHGPNCRDKDADCEGWAANGECDNSSRYMIPNCPKACGFCDNCGDKHERCQEWADRGECDKNPWYMLPHCNKACQLCK